MRIEDGDLYKELRQYLGHVYKYSINVSSFYYQNEMMGTSDTLGPPSKNRERETGTSSAAVVPLCVGTIPLLFLTLPRPAGKAGIHHQIYHPSSLGFVSGAGHTFWATDLWCDSPGSYLIGTRSCIRHRDKEGVIKVLLPQF